LGQFSKKRIIIVVICFVVTGILVYLKPGSTSQIKSVTLENALSTIPGWENKGNQPYQQNIVDALFLDDYVNSTYTKGNRTVSLYIGYYNSAQKVGAAHDPTVCFPGQGWVVSNQTTGRQKFSDGQTVNYSMMLAELGTTKNLLLYWFQSYDITCSSTFAQKLTLFWQKIFHQGESNAFVRLTVFVGDKDIKDCQKDAFDFMKDFYPVFLTYITNDN